MVSMVRSSGDASKGRTKTSTFFETFRRECAFTIFLTVARGYSFCAPAMVGEAALLGSVLVWCVDLMEFYASMREHFVVDFLHASCLRLSASLHDATMQKQLDVLYLCIATASRIPWSIR